MKVFVWEELDNVSPNYHSEGGLLVVAESLSAAIVLAESKDFVVVGETEPDYVYETTDDAEPRVLVFPNAGCC